MKRTLSAYMEFHISTEKAEMDYLPELQTIIFKEEETEKELAIDFEEVSATMKKTGNIINYCLQTQVLDLETFIDEWKTMKFIPEIIEDDEIEERIFDLIKNASSVSQFVLELTSRDDDEYFEGDIVLTKLVIYDTGTNEEIDLLEMTFEDDALDKNLTIQ